MPDIDLDPRVVWTVYEVLCAIPDHIYVGITAHIDRRERDHLNGKGHWFTFMCGAVEVRRVAIYHTEQEALDTEELLVNFWHDQGWIARGGTHTHMYWDYIRINNQWIERA